MKKITVIIPILLAVIFTVTPQVHAYSLPDSPNNVVYFGCLWRDASCTTNSVREEIPKTSEMPKFYLDVVEACTNAGYNGGVCALQASKAVVAAETYNTCIAESSGDAAGCKTATDFTVNQVTVAKAAPTDPNAAPPVAMQTLQPTPATPTQNSGTSQRSATPTQNGNGNIGYIPLEPIPGLAEAQSGNTNFALFLRYVFSVLISIGGLSAVVMLIFGGITYMVSDVVHKKTDALRRIQAAMWGLLLLIASWLILNAINPRLLVFELLINPTSNLSGNVSPNTLTTGTNNTTSLNLSNTDPNRDATLSSFCKTNGSITRTPGADGNSTNYTCTPYNNTGNVYYP